MNSFEVSVTVAHDKSHAWEYYFNQTNSWWPKEYHTSPETKRFLIEAYLGGKCYEDFGNGNGLVWGEIIGVDYTKSLLIRGNLAREFGGPAITFEKFTLEPDNQGNTTLTYTCDFVGDISPESVASLKKGWEEILQIKYKGYCDRH